MYSIPPSKTDFSDVKRVKYLLAYGLHPDPLTELTGSPRPLAGLRDRRRNVEKGKGRDRREKERKGKERKNGRGRAPPKFFCHNAPERVKLSQVK